MESEAMSEQSECRKASGGSSLAKASKLVDDLYEFRDQYFLVNGIESGAFKEQDVIERMDVSLLS